MAATIPTRVELLELDIDTRLHGLFNLLPTEAGPFDVYPVLRAAYGLGYVDALKEPEPGALCREHGYTVPERARA